MCAARRLGGSGKSVRLDCSSLHSCRLARSGRGLQAPSSSCDATSVLWHRGVTSNGSCWAGPSTVASACINTSRLPAQADCQLLSPSKLPPPAARVHVPPFRSPQRVAPDPYAPTDSLTSSSGYHWQGHEADPDFLPAPSPAFDIFEPRQAPAGGLEAVIGTPAAALGRLTGETMLWR